MPYYIETERLHLRAYRQEDISLVVTFMNDPDVNLPLDVCPFPFAYEDGKAFWSAMQRTYQAERPEFLVIADKDTDELMGGIGIHPEHTLRQRGYVGEMGYWLGKPHWGQGYMREALLAAMRFAFDKLNLKMIVSTTNVDNTRSMRVLQALGLSYLGVIPLQKPSLHGTKVVSSWEITRETFENNQTASS